VSDAKKAEKLAKKHQMQQMRPTMLESNLKNTKENQKPGKGYTENTREN